MINFDDLKDINSLEDLEREMLKRIHTHNTSPIANFEGLTPEEMASLQNNFPNNDAPLQMNTLTKSQLKACGLLQQVLFLMAKMKGGKTLKLTKTGALSTATVKEVYELGFLKNEMIEMGITKLYKEESAIEIVLTRILLQISSLVKKRKGMMSLTKLGEKYADDDNYILREILTLLFYQFNWAYFDGYTSERIGQLNSAYTLFLVLKYGDEERSAQFYAAKYFDAFPHLKSDDTNPYSCYELRTFKRYFRMMGFVNVEKKSFSELDTIRKTPFIDQLFTLKTP